jgi:quercetin dioxygenase-like cupin family protein
MDMTVTYEGILAKEESPLPKIPDFMLDKVAALQASMAKLTQYEPPTKHLFHGGIYCRQVWRPAGCTIVGRVHKKEHFYMVVSGTVCVTTDDGVDTITGPALLCSKPGTKRAVHALTDALCMTFHATEATDVEKAGEELVEPDETSMFTLDNKLKNTELGVSL